MAPSEPHNQVAFNNNPEIAAEIQREKTERTTRDSTSDLSEDTRVGQQERDAAAGAEKESHGADLDRPGTYDKIEITEEDCYNELGCKSSH